MSAEQGFYALVAIDRAANGENSLYRMGEVTKNTSKPSTSVTRRGNSSCQPQEDLIANHLAVETEEKFIQVCL